MSEQQPCTCPDQACAPKIEYTGTEGTQFGLLIEARKCLLILNQKLKTVDMEVNRGEWLDLIERKYKVYIIVKDLLERELRSAGNFIQDADRTRVDELLAQKDHLKNILNEGPK